MTIYLKTFVKDLFTFYYDDTHRNIKNFKNNKFRTRKHHIIQNPNFHDYVNIRSRACVIFFSFEVNSH